MKPDKNKALKAAIKDIKAKHPDCGYQRVIVESWLNMASFKVCRKKEITWIMPRWKVSLGD